MLKIESNRDPLKQLVFSQLGPQDLFNVSQVSQKFRKIANCDELWCKLAQKYLFIDLTGYTKTSNKEFTVRRLMTIHRLMKEVFKGEKLTCSPLDCLDFIPTLIPKERSQKQEESARYWCDIAASKGDLVLLKHMLARNIQPITSTLECAMESDDFECLKLILRKSVKPTWAIYETSQKMCSSEIQKLILQYYTTPGDYYLELSPEGYFFFTFLSRAMLH